MMVPHYYKPSTRFPGQMSESITPPAAYLSGERQAFCGSQRHSGGVEGREPEYLFAVGPGPYRHLLRGLKDGWHSRRRSAQRRPELQTLGLRACSPAILYWSGENAGTKSTGV